MTTAKIVEHTDQGSSQVGTAAVDATKTLKAYDFYRRFTFLEREAILQSTNTSVVTFVHDLKQAINAGADIKIGEGEDANDGIDLLVGLEIITLARGEEILA